MKDFIHDLANLTLFQMVVFGSVLIGVFYFAFYNLG